MFSDDQNKELAKPLNPANVKPPAPGKYGEYIEGWLVISEANRIFGFDGWNSTTELTQLGEPLEVSGKWRVNYRAKCRIEVGGVVREGCGFGQGIDKDIGQAHESALKEAETDARKRALMTFGNPFGLALYDKTKANVCAPEPEVPASVIAFLEGLKAAYATNSAETYWAQHWPAVDKEWRPYALEQKDQIKAAQGKVALLRAG